MPADHDKDPHFDVCLKCFLETLVEFRGPFEGKKDAHRQTEEFFTGFINGIISCLIWYKGMHTYSELLAAITEHAEKFPEAYKVLQSLYDKGLIKIDKTGVLEH